MPKKIFIAEDEEEIVDLLTTALSMAGYDVVSVMTGQNIPERVAAEKPDLLILDIMMPGQDEHILKGRLASSAFGSAPIIILTSRDSARAMMEKFPQVRLFLWKSFPANRLVGKIREILGE